MRSELAGHTAFTSSCFKEIRSINIIPAKKAWPVSVVGDIRCQESLLLTQSIKERQGGSLA